QPRVGGRGQAFCRDAPFELEVRHLALGVSAGVGAARAVHHMVLAGELAKRALQLGFDRTAARLLLPAGKAGPVVLEHEFDIHLLPSLTPLTPDPSPAGGRGCLSIDQFDNDHRRRVAYAPTFMQAAWVAAWALGR